MCLLVICIECRLLGQFTVCCQMCYEGLGLRDPVLHLLNYSDSSSLYKKENETISVKSGALSPIIYLVSRDLIHDRISLLPLGVMKVGNFHLNQVSGWYKTLICSAPSLANVLSNLISACLFLRREIYITFKS